MVTMQEYLTQTKGIEYGISVLFMLGYTAYWGVIKEKPFDVLRRTIREDLAYLRSCGYWKTVKLVGKIIGAPLLGLFYLIGMPFIFFFGVLYFAGKKVFGQSNVSTSS
ncbi:MAG: hypothetical protein ACYC9Y_04040 [Candidatus Methylomirabilia bacterium]